MLLVMHATMLKRMPHNTSIPAGALGTPPTSLAIVHVPILGSLPSSIQTTTHSTLAAAPISSRGLVSLLSAVTPAKPSPFVQASAIPPIPGSHAKDNGQ